MMEDDDVIVWRDYQKRIHIIEIAFALYFNPQRYDVQDLAEASLMLTPILDEPVSDTFEYIIRTTLCFFGWAEEFIVRPVIVVPRPTTRDDRRGFSYSFLIPYNWRDALDMRPHFRSAHYIVTCTKHTLVLKFDHPFVPYNVDDIVSIHLWAHGSTEGCGIGAHVRPGFVEHYIQMKRPVRTVLYIQCMLYSAFTEKLRGMGLMLNPFRLQTKSRIHLSPSDEEPNPEAIQALAERNGVIPLPE